MRARLLSVLQLTLTAIILINPSWAGEKVIWDFVANAKGAMPMSTLISDSTGNLYGTTELGGRYGWGTVFEFSPQGNGEWGETVLYSFSKGANGYLPYAGVVMDAAGNLYGTTNAGGNTASNCGSLGCGTVFELSPAGNGKWDYKLLYTFQGTDGSNPAASLVLDTSGNVYGTTTNGGPLSSGVCCGVVFKLSPGAHGNWNETVLFDFTCENGCPQGGGPSSGVIFDRAGNLYGTTQQGANGLDSGTVFELSPGSGGQWTETILYNFCNVNQYCPDGSLPNGGLTFDQAGNLYGTTIGGGVKMDGGAGVVFELTPGSGGTWNEKAIFVFRTGQEGIFPYGGVSFDSQGKLYGTTEGGGVGGSVCQAQYNIGCGVVFELSPGSNGWSETVLHNFRATDGANPVTGVLLDNSGNVYGTAPYSGTRSQPNGKGTFFKLSPSGGTWQATVIGFIFTDGEWPSSGLIPDGTGNLYGTTEFGGLYGFGAVFELSPTSGGGVHRSILYNFKGGSDGAGPGPLTWGNAGNLYGFTGGGGENSAGTVFELTPKAGGKWSEEILYAFGSGAYDGVAPVGSPVFDAAGNMYGATSEGGTTRCGTVFELSPSPNGNWTENILHDFVGGNADGWDPQAGVVMDSAGNLYGTTSIGGGTGDGGTGYGTVYELSPSADGTWTETLLYAFAGGTDGSYPNAAPVLDGKGNVYGAAYEGGQQECHDGCGLIFELSPSKGNGWQKTVIDLLGSEVANPEDLAFGTNGDLYVTSDQGNANSCPPICGAVFDLAPQTNGSWEENVIFNFYGELNGSYPRGPLVFDAAGNMYGAAVQGGPANQGLVFELLVK